MNRITGKESEVERGIAMMTKRIPGLPTKEIEIVHQFPGNIRNAALPVGIIIVEIPNQKTDTTPMEIGARNEPWKDI